MTKCLAYALMMSLGMACGGGDSAGTDAGGDGDAATGDWQSLISGDWHLDGLAEGYFCVYVTVPRDIYIKAFKPLIPLGTHHTVLTMYDGASPADGVYPCNVGTNGQNMIYGSGVGSPEFDFPTGIGLHLRQGQRLLLNLHLYNAGDTPLDGTSGTEFLEADPSEIAHESEIVLAGPTIGLYVPSGVTTQQGDCSISAITSEPLQLFSISQHMHRTGIHMKSVITRGADEIVLQDVNYDFESQTFQYVNPEIQLMPGDTLTTYCTYNNDGAPKTFGESTEDEMCFTDLFYYPAQGASFICGGGTF
jgi:copper type II ascorbate-dependent monooxygenase-like protein